MKRTPKIAGFTLLEVLVALGAVALISIGLARIFGATSQTLRTGRRLSTFNNVSRAMERSLREDFSRMARDGYLVIGHELTQDPVPRFQNDPSPRQRRIDQIMFFEHGRFHTLRTPLYPSRVASGADARIWIGHGLRQEPGMPISEPPLDDFNRDGGLSETLVVTDTAPWFGTDGPNKYAADWILMRHIAVLAQPKSSPPPRPQSLLFPTMDQWPDRDMQIDLAPAQTSLFRNLARGTPDMLPQRNQIARPHDQGVARPLFASGIVDVVSTDLSEIRSIILDAQSIDPQNPGVVFDPAADNNTDFYEVFPLGGGREQRPVPFAFQPDPTADGSRSCFAMKQWMLQGLPVEPRTQTRNFMPDPPVPFDLPPTTSSPDYGGRMRCELLPPDLLGTHAHNGQVYIQDEDYKRSDQTMLAASTFVPACTEFIVEWSFGETYLSDTNVNNTDPDEPDRFLGPDDLRTDQLIWHGLPRLAESDFVDGLDPGSDRIAGPYFGKVGSNEPNNVPNDLPIDIHYQQVRLTNGLFEPVPEYRPPLPARDTGVRGWPVQSRVIHEPVDNEGLPDPVAGEPFYSIFGYVDPTFQGPVVPDTAASDDPARFRPDTIPCQWPRLIRITMTIADPADPTYEQTYQFVFEVPGLDPAGGGD